MSCATSYTPEFPKLSHLQRPSETWIDLCQVSEEECGPLFLFCFPDPFLLGSARGSGPPFPRLLQGTMPSQFLEPL